MKYRTCDYCGSNLDHGERCDCEKELSVAECETVLIVDKKIYSKEPKYIAKYTGLVVDKTCELIASS